jgi:hydroxymethylpyrimidine/phosphomethylpyrimidine kinase
LNAIEQGASVQTGQGHGPLNHGFSPMAMRRLAAAEQA